MIQPYLYRNFRCICQIFTIIPAIDSRQDNKLPLTKILCLYICYPGDSTKSNSKKRILDNDQKQLLPGQSRYAGSF